MKRHIFFAISLSFLSSGTLLILIIILYANKNIFITNKKQLRLFSILTIILLLFMIGPIAHKLLFFFDPIQFDSANDVTLSAFDVITFDNLTILINNILDRSMLIESYESNNSKRLIIIGFLFTMMFMLLLFTHNKLIVLLFSLTLFGMMFEGLILYSLFFSIFILFYDYLYRQAKLYNG
jgi:hypothetical protein